LSYTERAPTFYELYADGEHHATGTYERGNSNNKKEKGTTLELGMKFKTPTTRANFSAYVTEFSNFIGLVQDGYVNHHGEYQSSNEDDCEGQAQLEKNRIVRLNTTSKASRLASMV
jgi:iron complex outermembrane recepter protein